jgi:cell division transport system permease protein
VGRGSHLCYVTHEAWLALRQKYRLHVTAMAMISVAVFIVAVFLWMTVNIRVWLHEVETQAKIITFLTDDVSPDQREAIAAELWRFPGTHSVRYVSREQAWHDFIAWFDDGKRLMEGLQQNPLPASYVMQLTPQTHDETAIQGLVQQLTRLSGVEEVEYGASWRQGFRAAARFIEGTSLVSGALLGVGIVFIIANTMRLTVYTRLSEIEIMQLVGAPERFIKGPFLLLGMVQGCLGALIALGLLWGLYLGLVDYMHQLLTVTFGLQQLVFLPWYIIAGVVLGCALLGCIGSAVTLSRSLRTLSVSS